MEKIAKYIVKWRNAILVIAFLLVIPSVMGYFNTGINYDILTYLPPQLESMIGQEILDKDYHSASMAMVTVENMEVKEVNALEDEIVDIEGVKDAIWIHDITQYIPSDMLPSEIVSMVDNGNAQLMLVTFDQGNGSTLTINAIDKIEDLLSDKASIGGLSAIVHDLKMLINQELPIYIVTAVVLCIIVLYLGLRYGVAPFIFMLGIGLAVIYNFGSNVIFGEISYITQALAAILQLAVSMDFSIFLLERYDEELGTYSDKEEAMTHAIVKTFKSISGSSLTTIAGFLAMCVMDLRLGTDMGRVMAKGVVLGVLSAVIILPALILIFDKQIHKHTHKSVFPYLRRLPKFTVKYYVIIPLLAVLLFIPFYKAQTKAPVYYNLIDSLPQDLPSTMGTKKLRDEFNMQTTHFILIPDDLSATDEQKVLDIIDQQDGIVSIMSVEEFLGAGIPEEFIPSEIKDIFQKGDTKMILANSEYASASKPQNEQIAHMNDQLKQVDERILITGEGALNKDLVTIADHDIKVVNWLSMAMVCVIIAIVFKSISIPILLVGVIELAITINMGIPYFTNQSIPFIASIVIGTIQLGATIDYAILLTSRYQEERNNGLKVKDAMIRAASASSHSILVSGFSFFAATLGVALLSKVDLIKVLCQMLARGAIISMVTILLILPSVLVLFAPIIEKTSYQFIKKGSKNHETNEVCENN